MRSLLAACLLALLHLSHQTTWEEGADAISQARGAAEKSARVALSEVRPDPSVLEFVVEELERLEKLGREDMRAIGAFGGPGDKDLAVADGVRYWRARMEDFVQPYVTHPESFKDVKYGGEDTGPADPDNQSPEYLSTVAEMDRMVEQAYAALERRHSELTAGEPANVREVTACTARREGAGQALRAAKAEIHRAEQLSKKFADRGETQTAINRLRVQIQASQSNFEANIRDIFNNLPKSV